MARQERGALCASTDMGDLLMDAVSLVSNNMSGFWNSNEQ